MSYIRTAEHRKLMSEKLKGIKHSDEHRSNLSKSLKGNPKLLGNQHWKKRDHKKMTEKIIIAMQRPEVKEKLRQAAIKQWSDPENRKKHSERCKGRTSFIKGKTFEEAHGFLKAQELKELMRKRNIGKKYSYEVNKKKGLKGDLNPMKDPEVRKKQLLAVRTYGKQWKGGISYAPYSIDFTNSLKESVRDRDNHKCMYCDIEEVYLKDSLQVHHIDYNKNNCDINNLISLCPMCHGKTNYNREEWKKYFERLIKEKYERTEREETSTIMVVG